MERELHLIDTHAHIYLPEFDEDRAVCIENARRAGVETILMPAIDASTHEQMVRVEEEFGHCRSMIGLHPCSVKGDFEQELARVEDWLQRRPFVAIGEIGLDFYWDKTFTEQQYQAFRAQIRLALDQNLPVVIHSRNATDECIDVVEEFPGLRGVFHCFSGNASQARSILKAGLMLGIGGVVTFKNGGLDKVITETGLEGVMLETDAPYLAPVPYRGKRNEPAYTRLVAEKLSALTGLDLPEISRITTGNAKKLFALG